MSMITAQFETWADLIQAVQHNNIELARVILENNSNTRSPNFGHSILKSVRPETHLEMIILLLSYCKHDTAAITTAFSDAIFYKDTKQYKLLVDAGADVRKVIKTYTDYYGHDDKHVKEIEKYL